VGLLSKKKIFPIVENYGYIRDNMNIAWDLITFSRQSSVGRAEKMRDLAIDHVTNNGITFSMTKIEDLSESCKNDKDNSTIGRRIWGQLNVPSFLTSGRGSVIQGDSIENLKVTGKLTTSFLFQIPCSLIKSPTPSLIMQYGHGLMGDKTEGQVKYLRQMANNYNWILVSMDWFGMSRFDFLNLLRIMSDPSKFAILPENVVQGYVNFIIAIKLFTSPTFMNHDSFKVNGQSVLSTKIGYYGNSQGGILGGGYMGLTPTIQRGVLGVVGGPFALLLSRSTEFNLYHDFMTFTFFKWKDIRIVISLFQQLWDIGETSGWTQTLRDSKKRLLLHCSPSDSEVTYLGAEILARSINASTIDYPISTIYNVSQASAPFFGNVIVEWYFDGVPLDPNKNLPPPIDYNTHECPRRLKEAQDQIHDFLEDGVVKHYCNGQCKFSWENNCKNWRSM